MELEVYTTNVELQDIPSYTTNITLEGQLLRLSFLWNERIGKRILSIKNSADQCYLQNTILHPNEPFELNANAVLNDLPYSVTLLKTGDQKKVGNIFNWSKDFILCFSRTVDVEVEKLNVVYGVTKPSTPSIPPNGGNSGGGSTPPVDPEQPLPNEMYFITTNGIINYVGNQGDQILLSDGNVVDITVTDDVVSFTAPAGKHKVTLVESRSSDFVGLGGGALVELHDFPTLSSVEYFSFLPYSLNNNLIKVPDVLPPNIIYLTSMFFGATSFNQDISMWNTSNIINMDFMFADATSFNQDISMWDTSNVINMEGMFENATSFEQDLSQWCVPNIVSKPPYFDHNAPLFTEDKHPLWGTCPT